MLSLNTSRQETGSQARTKAISLRQAWLKYRIDFRENGRVVPEDFWALKEINLEVNRGEIIGLIGENGAGKTTLLKLIAGMLAPDKGAVEVNGTVSALMEIGAGLQQDLTGRENIYLVSSLSGLSKAQVDERFEDIVRFAEIGRFINAPVKIYSQGMYMRLAFAIAIHVHPDILLLDDMFVVGDVYAQHKCVHKIFELKERGMTILFALQDLEMLKRVCSRGVFLREGAIIRDGPVDAVCGYYMETVGSREGIGIVQKDPLGVIFNNGKLILRWKNQTITCNLGGHSSMLIAGREYLSTTAEWQVQDVQPNGEIVAAGTWPDIPVTQYWKIRFLNEKEFSWEIALKAPTRISIEKIDIRNFFIDTYKNWLTVDGERDFPPAFVHEMKGNCAVIDDPASGVVGLKGDHLAGRDLPTVIFDTLHDAAKTICQAGNTGSEICGRIVQHQVFSLHSDSYYGEGTHRCFSVRLKLFGAEEEAQVKGYLAHARQIIRESTIIRKGPLSLYCKDNRIELYWQDTLLTREAGLNTKFRCQDRDYGASLGHWNVCKKGEEEIIIGISWDDDPSFTQTWKLSLHSEDTIRWEVETNSVKNIKLRQKQVELVLSEAYERWFTAREQGDFAKLEKKGGAAGLNNYIAASMGVGCVGGHQDMLLPTIIFNQEDTIPRASFIYKLEEQDLNTALRYLALDFQKDFYTPPGACTYFKGTIQIGPGVRIGADHPAMESNTRPPVFRLNRTSVVFDHGKGKIFWNGRELTKGLGMYSSIFSNGVWHDSSQAFWEIVQSEETRLSCIGHWCWVPMRQSWEIALLDEKTISWKVEKTAWDAFPVEKEQVNIMLSDAYREWFVHKQFHERFPAQFREHNGAFWDRLWCREGAFPIGLKKCALKKDILDRQHLPTVVFDCPGNCQARYSAIENTDDLFQARVLQYELHQNQKSGTEPVAYFEGHIKIIP